MTREEKKINEIDKRVDSLETTFKMFMQEMRDFKTEMRNRDNQRAKEIMEIRQDMKDMQTRFYTKIDNMDAKIDGIGKHVQNLTVAAIVGMGAAVAGIGAIAVTVMYSILR